MAETSKENLEELFGKFLDAEQARGAVEDIREGEWILRESSAPEPSFELKEQIKWRIGEALERRRARSYRLIMREVVAVAAIIVFVFAVSIHLFEGPQPTEERQMVKLISASVWDGNNIIADDAELSVLAAEIDQIEDDIVTVQSGQSYGNGADAVTELELELIEIDSEFWKG